MKCNRKNNFFWHIRDGLWTFEQWWAETCGQFRFTLVTRIGNGKDKGNEEETKAITRDAFLDGFRLGAMFQRSINPDKQMDVICYEQERVLEDAGIKLKPTDLYHGRELNDFTCDDCGGRDCSHGQVNPKLGGCGCGEA